MTSPANREPWQRLWAAPHCSAPTSQAGFTYSFLLGSLFSNRHLPLFCYVLHEFLSIHHKCLNAPFPHFNPCFQLLFQLRPETQDMLITSNLVKPKRNDSPKILPTLRDIISLTSGSWTRLEWPEISLAWFIHNILEGGKKWEPWAWPLKLWCRKLEAAPGKLQQ